MLDTAYEDFGGERQAHTDEWEMRVFPAFAAILSVGLWDPIMIKEKHRDGLLESP